MLVGASVAPYYLPRRFLRISVLFTSERRSLGGAQIGWGEGMLRREGKLTEGLLRKNNGALRQQHVISGSPDADTTRDQSRRSKNASSNASAHTRKRSGRSERAGSEVARRTSAHHSTFRREGRGLSVLETSLPTVAPGTATNERVPLLVLWREAAQRGGIGEKPDVLLRQRRIFACTPFCAIRTCRWESTDVCTFFSSRRTHKTNK